MNTKVIVVVGVIAIALIVGYVFVSNKRTSPTSQSPASESLVSNDEIAGSQPGGNIQILAGENSLYIVFDEGAYKGALTSGNVIFLNFYADWCPICRAEAPDIVSGFDNLTTDNVIGFRVNYNDAETNDAEKTLAKEYGITYQHTKVILKDGKVVYKATEQWSKDDVVKKLNSY